MGVTLRAAVTAAPLEMPTKSPSSLANRFAMAMLSSLLTCRGDYRARQCFVGLRGDPCTDNR